MSSRRYLSEIDICIGDISVYRTRTSHQGLGQNLRIVRGPDVVVWSILSNRKASPAKLLDENDAQMMVGLRCCTRRATRYLMWDCGCLRPQLALEPHHQTLRLEQAFCDEDNTRELLGRLTYYRFAQGRTHHPFPSIESPVFNWPLTFAQMLPQRIVRTSALRNSLMAARRAPIVQRRGFLPTQYSDKKTLDEKYPDPPQMSAAEDPDMVSGRSPNDSVVTADN